MSETSPFAGWLHWPPGTHFRRSAIGLSAAAQARQHAACDMPAGLFGSRLDPTLLGQDMVLMASRAGLPVDGRVHLAHHILQRAPVRLGASCEIGGRIERLAGAPRGHEVEIGATVEPVPASGEAPVELAACYLLPGLAPLAVGAPSSATAPNMPAALTSIGRLQLTPERVMNYSADVGNLLHFDPGFAAARGFRAPIAQGLMLVTAFFGALARARGAVPDRFELRARFRRPAFWDDRLEFQLDSERWLCLAADGRVLVEGELRLASSPQP